MVLHLAILDMILDMNPSSCGPQWKLVTCQGLNLLLDGGKINGRGQDDGGGRESGLLDLFSLSGVAGGSVFVAGSGWSSLVTIFSLPCT